jgi:photosystem II stability/assembly factor-like uncharacterized protein
MSKFHKMNKDFLIRLVIVPLMFVVILIMTGLLPGCNQIKENSGSQKAESPNDRNDNWAIVGYGGGGAMFNPSVSPHNPDYSYVACDMSQSFVTYNGGESWRMINLRGMVQFFAFDPLDSNTIYAKSICLFRSTDKGNEWNVIYPDPSEITGIVSKGDEANEYIITKDSTKRKVLAFSVDPANSKMLYAAISIDKENGFYFSNDAGTHWTKDKILEDGAKNIFVLPSSPENNRTIYITGENTVTEKENGLWKINKGPEGVKKLTQFAGGFDHKLNKYIIYATSGKSYFNSAGDKSGIWYTENGGESWENREEGLVNLHMENSDKPEWRCIATSSLNPNVLYVSYNGLKVQADTTCLGIAKSEDFGRTWQLTLKDCLTDQNYRFSSNYSQGWLDERYGPTWGENPFAIAVYPNNPDISYATDFGRTIKTTDGGRNWKQLYSRKKNSGGWSSTGLDVTTGYTIVFDPFDQKHVFNANTDVGLMESKDGGESWISATKNNGIPDKWINTTYWLAFDPDVKGKAWSVMSGIHDLPLYKMWRKNGTTGFTGGILVTEDGGVSWKTQSENIGEAAFTYILIDTESRKEKRTLYACAFGKGVYKSIDGGETWMLKNNGIDGKDPLAFKITKRTQDGMLFLLVHRRNDEGGIGNDQDGALYTSIDEAETWIKKPLPSETNCLTGLLIDPENPDKILISAWGRNTEDQFSPSIGGGIYISEDGGKTWKQTLKKDQYIFDLTFDPRNKMYYACGFSFSAYRSENQGKTWERIKGFNHKLGRRVDIDPVNQEMIYINTYGGGVWHGPAKGDPNAIEDIITPVLTY